MLGCRWKDEHANITMDVDADQELFLVPPSNILYKYEASIQIIFSAFTGTLSMLHFCFHGNFSVILPPHQQT